MGSRRRIKDILDSDDELPTTYKDIAVTPAYQDDNRFPEKAIYLLTKGDDDSSNYSSDISSVQGSDSEELLIVEFKENSPSYLRKGVLSRKDAYCIKVFGTVYNDDTLLWFINFTISKDIQSNYSFLTSCLASDDKCYVPQSDNKKYCNQRNKDCDKKIVFEYK